MLCHFRIASYFMLLVSLQSLLLCKFKIFALNTMYGKFSKHILKWFVKWLYSDRTLFWCTEALKGLKLQNIATKHWSSLWPMYGPSALTNIGQLTFKDIKFQGFYVRFYRCLQNLTFLKLSNWLLQLLTTCSSVKIYTRTILFKVNFIIIIILKLL